MPVHPLLGRLVVVGHDREAEVGAGVLRPKTRSELDCLRGRIAARAGDDRDAPAACSTVALMSRQCSSKSTVGDSPVVPTITMPAVPFAMWKSMSLRSAGRSSAPPSCIGVAIATRLPVSMSSTAKLPHFTPWRDNARPLRPELRPRSRRRASSGGGHGAPPRPRRGVAGRPAGPRGDRLARSATAMARGEAQSAVRLAHR